MTAPRFQIRPLGLWDRPVTELRADSGRFRAGWDDTIALLVGEVEKLDGDLIVVQVDADPGEIRRDGMLRARANVRFPGVKVSFESKHGPLTYATDAYDTWLGNAHAIVLTLQSLAAVDQIGMRPSAQYIGFSSLGRLQRTPPGAIAIPLRDRRKRVVGHALIDQADSHLANMPWYRLASGYVVRTEIRDGRKRMRYLHRAVFDLGFSEDDSTHVDHVDGNRLDNRRQNLRHAGPSENGQNRGANRGRTLPRGVYYRPRLGAYLAVAKLNGVRYELGLFETADAANRVVSAWRATNMPFSADFRRAASPARSAGAARDVLLGGVA